MELHTRFPDQLGSIRHLKSDLVQIRPSEEIGQILAGFHRETVGIHGHRCEVATVDLDERFYLNNDMLGLG